MIELENCPFCGNTKIIDAYIRDGRCVGCSGCGAGVQAYNPQATEKAKQLWNTRATTKREQELVDLIKRHHQHHLDVGEVILVMEGDVDNVALNLSLEYSDSSIYDETIKALATHKGETND